MVTWINKDTELYCSFAKVAGNSGCQMMNTAFYYYNLNKIYKSFSVDNIEQAIAAVKTLNIKGCAITMPYKIDVLNYVDAITYEAKEIGAANTIINNDGYLTAYNTDYIAAKSILNEFGRRSKPHDKLYVLGNGGYARSVSRAIHKLGYGIIWITRDNWNEIKNIRNSIIYNCTPVEDIVVDKSNTFIDCLVSTETGKKLAKMQAAHQFKLYTGLDFPL